MERNVEAANEPNGGLVVTISLPEKHAITKQQAASSQNPDKLVASCFVKRSLLFTVCC